MPRHPPQRRLPPRPYSPKTPMSATEDTGTTPRPLLFAPPMVDGKAFGARLKELLVDAGVEVQRIAPGDWVFMEGDRGDSAYFIGSGSIDIVTHGPDGTERLLNRHGGGELFGEMTLLDQTRRSAGARSREGAELFVVTRDEMMTLLRREPQMALWMLGLFSHRLRVLTRMASQMEQAQEVNLKILAGQNRERRRIGRDIHDGVAQSFASSILQLQSVALILDRDPDRARSLLEELENDLRAGLVKIRDLIHNLFPKELSQNGLAGAINRLLDRVARSDELEATFEHRGLQDELPAALEAALYCIVQEALNNVTKHAGASAVEVDLRRDEQSLTLVIRDNGCGFDADRAAVDRAGSDTYGLMSMQERVQLADGTMEIASRPGAGTELRFVIPLPAPGRRRYSRDVPHR